MTKTLLLLFILVTTLLAPAARADFEADLSNTGNTTNIKTLLETRRRADAGDANAQLNMGGLYFKGQDVAQDYAEAAKWFLLAAQQGQAQAQFNLGMMYATGQGVTQNHDESVQWYRRAAVQGLAVAQLNLGVAYATGQGVLQDEVEAVKWLRLAAEQGEPQAQFNLGVMYANGQGVTQNLVESYLWARLADAQGHESAKALMADLAKRMTTEQIALANNLTDTERLTNTGGKPQVATSIAETGIVSGGIYLQLGAFKTHDEAIKLLNKIKSKQIENGGKLDLYQADDWIRVQIGPYPSPSLARKEAARLKAKLGISPILKRR